MEFYSDIKVTVSNLEVFKQKLSIAHLPELCASITSLISDQKSRGRMYCLWGEFEICREELAHGVRFSLPGCPNAMSWSITFDRSTEVILIHLTINRKQHEADFIESIEQFVSDWTVGIKAQKFNHA